MIDSEGEYIKKAEAHHWDLPFISFVGRLKGIEPSNVGTTTRCVNHFATAAKL